MKFKHGNPRHNNPKQGASIAHAPYNFVSLPEEVVAVETIPPQNTFSGYSGYVECTLTTKSPLYTRAGLSAAAFKDWGNKPFHELPSEVQNERAQFFNLGDAERPIIPGSSLRGMVRNLVEIASYSKVHWVTDDLLFFRSISEAFYRDYLLHEDSHNRYTPLLKAGYLEQNGPDWTIQPAQEIGGTTFARIHHEVIPTELAKWHDCENAHPIWVKLGRYEYQNIRGGSVKMKYTPVLDARASNTPGFCEAVLAFSGPMDKKEREAVIYPLDTAARPIPIDDELIRLYREQISPEQTKLLGDKGALNPHQPVFYLMQHGRVVFFGHVMLFRLPYENTPWGLIPEQLRSLTDIDIAEAVFGFVNEDDGDKRQAHAGRVFFSDATLVPGQKDYWLSDEPFAPKILGSPKPTAFQHYLTQQEPDPVESGKTDKQGNPKTVRRLDHYNSPPPHETTLRGHKQYWHRDQVMLNDIRELDEKALVEKYRQYTHIRPVKDEVVFTFRVRFENLCEFELGALLWALALPCPEDSRCHHKLGMGKPLGMGAVEITPTLYVSWRHSQNGRYSALFAKSQEQEALPQWQLAEVQTDRQDFVNAFETYVLENVSKLDRDRASHFSELPRIQQLSTILAWPGPPQSKTDYMPLEKFKRRPVLPDPLTVVAGQPVHPPAPTRQQNQQASSPPSTSEVKTGVVKEWLAERGIGTITQADGSEIRVHHTGIIGRGWKSLQTGQHVSYTIGNFHGRPQAENVRVL